MDISALYKCFTECGKVTTDSRNCPEGSMFIALKGETFNGNAYALQALEKGCQYAVVDEKEYAADGHPRILLVDDCLKALQELANYHRHKMGTRIIGITGTNGKLMDLSHPQVMGILNVTPDSFYAGSRQQTEKDIINRTSQIIEEGASIIDIGAYSSRPNAEHISPEEEMRRLRTGLEIINRYHPGCVVSVDTFRADVARMCVEEYGVAIINDIAAGEMDPQMFDMIARLGVPYIIMHMQGTPQNMQMNPHYDNLLKEVFLYFSEKVQKLRDLGVKDIILDPGFGFGKTVEHNYQLMNHLEEFSLFELPLLVGISRKSMIYKLLGGTPDDALNGTTVLDTISLLKGADILRVHDVKAAVETVKIVQKMKDSAAF